MLGRRIRKPAAGAGKVIWRKYPAHYRASGARQAFRGNSQCKLLSMNILHKTFGTFSIGRDRGWSGLIKVNQGII
jgi:hypothetical protein